MFPDLVGFRLLIRPSIIRREKHRPDRFTRQLLAHDTPLLFLHYSGNG